LIYALKKNFQLKQTPKISIDIIFTLKIKRAHKKLWAFFYCLRNIYFYLLDLYYK
jgi:hypothetical protein